VSGPPALVCLVARLQVAHLHLDEGAALAGRNDLLLQHGPAPAFMLDDLAGANQVRLLFHEFVRSKDLEWCRLLDPRAGEGQVYHAPSGRWPTPKMPISPP